MSFNDVTFSELLLLQLHTGLSILLAFFLFSETSTSISKTSLDGSKRRKLRPELSELRKESVESSTSTIYNYNYQVCDNFDKQGQTLDYRPMEIGISFLSAFISHARVA